MATEALPDALHLDGKLRIEPDNIAVVRPVTADSKRLEDTCGSRDFLEDLHTEVILQGGRLPTGMVSNPELAHPRLPYKQRPVVQGLVRVVCLNGLPVANPAPRCVGYRQN